jgi:hypothetical protein
MESLVELCGQVLPEPLPTSLLEPSMRDLLHRVLPYKRQVDELGEYREYNAKGRLIGKSIYKDRRKIIEYIHYADGTSFYAYYDGPSKFADYIKMTFTRVGKIRSVVINNPVAGFDLYVRCDGDGFIYQPSIKSGSTIVNHGLSRQVNACTDKYQLFVRGKLVYTMENDLELD